MFKWNWNYLFRYEQIGDIRGSIVYLRGTICLGVNKTDESMIRCQGWGPLLGDKGGGYDIGLAVLRAVMRSHDGTGPETALKDAVLAHCAVAGPPELVAWAYAGEREWQRYAALAPLAEQCASRGDQVAMAIIKETVDALMDALCGVHARMQGQLVHDKDGAWTCVLAGGTLTHENSAYTPLLKEAIASRFGGAVRVVLPTVSAAHAAALMAMKKYKQVE